MSDPEHVTGVGAEWIDRHVASLHDEIDRLRAELAWHKDNVRCTDEELGCECRRARPVIDDQSGRLRAELADTEALYEEFVDRYDLAADRAAKAEARLAEVLALCDDDFLWPEGHRIQDTVRAAATGGTK